MSLYKKISSVLQKFNPKPTFKKIVVLPNGMQDEFYITKDKDSVGIFAITQDNKVVLVKQWRPNTEKEEIEIPGGGVEENEDINKAAIRELKEETGYGGDFIHLASLQYSPYSLGKRHLFLCKNAKKIENELDLDPNEFLKVIIMDLDEVKEKIKNGKIRGFEAIYMGLDKL